MCAEDNFATLTNLRPVKDSEGKPIMSSGNFAVVFKMQDITNKKLYAIKCFIKDQKGRSHAYKIITEELSKETSTYITNFQYLEDELFVALNGGEEVEVPIVKMDWIDGVSLDKYIEQHIDDSFSLTYLAYQFVGFTNWLLSRTFAHGDLKPDNILVDEDCKIVMIDYDGMFMPSFNSNIVNEIGSSEYQHPLRTSERFSKEIDDFSLLVILIEILYSNVLKELKSPIFSKQDYNNITESFKIKQIFPTANATLNIAITELINSLLGNNINISNQIFLRLNSLISTAYYEASCNECRRLMDEYKEDKKSIWDFYNRGYRGKEENYPILPSIYVKGYDHEHDGYPCNIKDGCLLQVSDTDGGSYMGETWDEDWDSIIVPDNIITISDEAFKGCYYIEYIVLPNSVKSIGNKVFQNCGHLQYIVLPEKIERIGNHLLNLWPNDYIESNVCKDIQLLERFDKDIVIPTTDAKGCKEVLKYLILKDIPQEYLNLLDIYNDCCINFKNFLVPNGCKEYYQKLMPRYSDYIMEFSEFVNSDDVNVNPLTLCIAEKIGAEHSKIIKYTGEEENIFISSGVKTICSYAFAKNSKLKKVIIPESMKYIGENVFDGCKNLESIVLPNTMTSIPKGFLHGCESLRELVLPSSIKYIEDYAFAYCKCLKKIYIPQGVIKIGTNAFERCESLNSIILPSTVTEIGNSTFSGCKALVNVTLPGKMTKIGGELFRDCCSLVAIEIPYGITSIPTYCFYGCKSLRYISLPNTIELISNNAFSHCSELNSIVLPSSLKSISSGAFSESGLTKIRIPENVEKIEHSAFKQCRKLHSVEIPSKTKLRKIEKSLFEECESLVELSIPDSIEEIEGWVFSGCKHLKQITLPSHINKIDNGLFSGCINLEYVHHINNIVSIGQSAFFRCRNLKQLILPIQLKEIGHNSLCGINIKYIEIESPHFEKDNVAIYSKGKKSLIEVLVTSPDHTIPDSIEEIKEWASNGFRSSWTIPDSVEEIREWAFNGCILSKLTIPNSVKKIENNAFVSTIIKRLEIHSMIEVSIHSFCKEIKEIAVPKHLLNYYKKSALAPNGRNIYDIDKKIICLE